jgi:hypothetical protein
MDATGFRKQQPRTMHSYYAEKLSADASTLVMISDWRCVGFDLGLGACVRGTPRVWVNAFRVMQEKGRPTNRAAKSVELHACLME